MTFVCLYHIIVANRTKKIKRQTDTHYEQKGKYYSMKWHVTDGKENVKSFDTHSETQEFVRAHPDWYELMS